MKRKDIGYLQSVCGLYAVCISMSGLLDEISEDDLPEMFGESYRALKAAVESVEACVESYREVADKTFSPLYED